jgi:molybdopterin-guanine dinucleotide biosynthesis protein A
VKCTGILLAGGAARRFGGRPKGLAIVKEQRIADRVLIALAGASDRQVVVSNDPEADDWFPKLRVVPDAEPGLGPLAGIETGLIAAKGTAIVIVAWDMPFVTAPLLRGMRALGELGADAVVPVHRDVTEALCAWYAPSAQPVARELIAHGERRAAALAEALPNVVRIPEHVLEQHGEMQRLFMSIDSPEQLAEIGGNFP